MTLFRTLRSLVWAFLFLPSFASAQFVVMIQTTSVSCYGQNDGAATALATGGTEPYQYLWSNGETSQAIANLSPGLYSLTVTDASSAVVTNAAFVTQPQQLGVTAFGTSQLCSESPDGSATAVPFGGTPPYSYVWSNGISAAQISGLTAGTYTVTVTDHKGCTATGNATVIFLDEGLWVLTEKTDASCAGGGQDGTAHAAAMSGTPPYSFLWSNGASTQDVDGLSSGLYSVTVTDANGCYHAENVFILQTGFDLSANVDDATCLHAGDGSISLTVANGLPPVSFLWSNGSDTPTISGLNDGIYTVTIHDAGGCSQVQEFFVGLQFPGSCGDTMTAIVDTCLQCPTSIPDGGTIYTEIAVACATNNDLSDPQQGLCAVHLRFKHDYLGDLSAILYSPAGQSVQLLGPAVFSGPTDGSAWDVLFVPCGSAALPDDTLSSTWSNDQPWGLFSDFNGNYYPNIGCLETFDTGPVNGIWQLVIQDNLAIDSGFLYTVDLIFCDDTAPDSCGPAAAALAVDFSFQVDQNSIQCLNESLYATHYRWTFNNSTISTQANPVFTAPGPGDYPIKLQAWNSVDTLTKTLIATVSTVGASTVVLPEIQVYPNPFTDYLLIDGLPGKSESRLRLLDLNGRILKETTTWTASSRLNSLDLPSGVYILQVNNSDSVVFKKVVKN